MARWKTRLSLVAALLAGAGVAAFLWFDQQRDELPDGIVVGNGRLEADQVDIAPKYSGRVDSIQASEGALVEAGQLLALIDTRELLATLDRAQAEAALARDTLSEAEALVAQRRSELRLADQELVRAATLVEKGHVSTSIFEQRQTDRDVAQAALRAAEAHVGTVERQIVAAEAEVRRIESQIIDHELIAPVTGRVLYRLAEPGEVLAAGQPILTLLSLENIYMEIFLPAEDAGRLPLGAEARIVVDPMPDYAIPAHVSFVSPEAQFTPKQVETLAEREKLVFRVRVRIPPELVANRTTHVKTGIRGVAYVRLRPSVEWPERLNRRMPPELFE
ncbi:MAG: HlyD family secretion protein [Geminicoccaceae bacterium]